MLLCKDQKESTYKNMHLYLEQKAEESENTFLDGMVEHIKEENKDVDVVETVTKYVDENEYDSDAVKQDLENVSSSNILNTIGYGICDGLMTNYIRNVQCMSDLFLFYNHKIQLNYSWIILNNCE